MTQPTMPDPIVNSRVGLNVNLLLASLDAAAERGIRITSDAEIEGRTFIWRLGNVTPCFMCAHSGPIKAPQGEPVTSKQYSLCQKRGDIHAPHRVEVCCPDAQRAKSTEAIEHISISVMDGELFVDPCGPVDLEELRGAAIMCGPVVLDLGGR